MTRDAHRSVFGTYQDTGYVFGNQVWTCCRNCARRNGCPVEKRGKKCRNTGHACDSCPLWNRRGCRYFVLDWSVLKI